MHAYIEDLSKKICLVFEVSAKRERGLALERGHTEAKSRDSASDDTRLRSNLSIRRCKIIKNRPMLHRLASRDFHRLILNQAILV